MFVMVTWPLFDTLPEPISAKCLVTDSIQTRDCSPGPLFSIQGFRIGESLIPRSLDPAGITGIPGLEIPQSWIPGLRKRVRDCKPITDSPLCERHVYRKLTISAAYSAMIVVIHSMFGDRKITQLNKFNGPCSVDGFQLSRLRSN